MILAILGIAAVLGSEIVPSVLTLEGLRRHISALREFRDLHPVGTALGYMGCYVLLTALSLPGGLVMTVGGGALFGLAEGVLLTSFSSSLGATLAMLASRFLFRDFVARYLGARLARVDLGLAGSGWVYLASLRLAPVLPFVMVNLLFGLTTFPPRRFYVISQLCMLPATIVYVNAGSQLAMLTSVSRILSPSVLGALLLLAVLGPTSRFVLHRLLRPS